MKTPSISRELMLIKAEQIKARILSGEQVPEGDLIEFLSLGDVSLQAEKKTLNKPTDVEFF